MSFARPFHFEYSLDIQNSGTYKAVLKGYLLLKVFGEANIGLLFNGLIIVAYSADDVLALV